VTEFWRITPEGVAVAVKVQPKSRRPGVQGRAPAVDGERLRIGVTEAAEGGRANKAACATLARALGVAVGQVSVAAGASSREKTLMVDGDAQAIIGGLQAL
jgi:uncharacterized protein YggU (UPF0235/DUF167 family)